MNERNLVNPDATSDAESNVACITCGYDLRGQTIDSNCPECGTPVERSLRDDRLHNADPAWLKMITRGQRLFMLGVGLVAAFIPIFIIAMIVIGVALAGLASNSLVEIPRTAGFVSLIAGFILGAIGVMLLTKTEPRAARRETEFSPNHVARVAAICAILVFALHSALTDTGLVVFPPLLHRLGFLTLAIFVTIACAAVFRRLAELALRIPDADLEKRMRRHFKLVIWCVPLLFLAQVFQKPVAGAATPFDLLEIATGIASLVAGIASLVLLVELCRTMQLFRRRLKHCLEQNRAAQIPTRR